MPRRWPVLLLLCALGCQPARPRNVSISAAASTREAIIEIANLFHKQGGPVVTINTGPSSALARQIELGEDADLFLSADEDWANDLEKNGLVAERCDLLGNRLVVVVPEPSTLPIKQLADVALPALRRLALAAPAVPAGHYARETLNRAGLWDKVKDRVLQGSDVRATLAYVVRGEAEAGFVYATDALAVKGVRVAVKVDPALHQPIRYPLVLIKRAAPLPAARDFYEMLQSKAAADCFRRHGFEVLR